MRSYKTLARLFLCLGLFVTAAFAQGPVTFGPQTIANQAVGGYTNVTINTINGGNQPYTVAVTAGALPPGLAVSIDFQGGAQITGTPTTTGTFPFTLTATDSSTPALTASQSFSITVVTNPLAIAPVQTSLPGVVSVPYKNIYATGGTPPYNWTITHGTLPGPSGLTLNATTIGQTGGFNGISYAVTGTPTTAGTYSFTLQVTDSSATPLQATQTFVISVINPVAYVLPNPNPAQALTPLGIASGNNSLWFTEQAGAGVAVQNLTTGAVFKNKIVIPASTAFPNPSPGPVVTGADGYVWAVDTQNPVIYRIAPNGSAVTTVSLQYNTVPPDLVVAQGIAAGPGSDGHVWFVGTGETANQGYIGSITTDGSNTVTFYPVPSGIYLPYSIVPDPDGAHLWFVAQSEPSALTLVVGRIGIDGTYDAPSQCVANSPIKNFNGCIIFGPGATPGGVSLLPPDGAGVGNSTSYGPWLVVGSDNNVWFASGSTNAGVSYLGKLASDGSSTTLYTVTQPIGSMVSGDDGAIWYTLKPDGNQIGRTTTAGVSSTFTLPSASATSSPATFADLTSGPDGALWLTDNTGDAIFQVFPSLVLNCTVGGTLQVGVPITNASCTAVGGKAPYTYSFDESHLPPGVTVSASGVLSGTPTGPGSFTISANDSSSPAQLASQVFSIQAAAPVQLACNFPTVGKAGQPYAGACSTLGGNAPYTYTVSPALPAGLTGVPTSVTDPVSGVTSYGYSVSGTLSPSAAGAIAFSITAVDSTTPTPNTSLAQSVTINVSPIPPTLACAGNPRAIVNQPYQQSCFASFGALPYTFAATGLPAGLSISATSGLISGTPTAPGLAVATVTLSDAIQETATQTVNFSIISQPLGLACNFPFNPTAGTALSVPCVASGGTGPFTYALLSGALPAGLTLNSTSGLISGTPATGGTFTFTLTVTDSEVPTVTALQVVTINVQGGPLAITSTTLPVPNPGLPYAVSPQVAGGKPPYTFAVTTGALPAGLTLAASTGTIYSTGTLTPGAYSFTLTVTDSANATASQVYSGTVLAAFSESFTSFALPTASGANGITVGADGNLWFTTIDQAGGNLIGRITPTGVITTTPSANPLTQSNGTIFELPMGGDIAAGPDGEIWVAQHDGSAVGEVATDLSSQLSYLTKTASAGPAQIISAPDGTVWFTETQASQIAHVGTGGTVVEYPTPTATAGPYGIAVGPDNFIAFTEAEPNVNKIAVITEDGATKIEFPIPTPASLPTSIVLGPDSALWFTEFGANKIGRMDFAGNFIEVPVSGAPSAITLGPDNALYFTETAANKIGRLTIAGVLTEIPVSDANSGPTGIVAGPDGSIWFTENNLSKIGRMSFILAPTVSCTLPAGPLAAQSAFAGTCTATQGTAPYQFSFSTAAGSTPPPGLTIDPATGAISGTLTTAGTFSFAVVVTDSSLPAQTAQQTYTFTVSPLPLSLSCNTPTARLYTPYAPSSGNYGCSASNGTPPYTYALSAGTIAPGLTFDPTTGNITGTPTTLGDYPITISAMDSSVPPMTATQAVTLSVQYGVISGKGTQLFSLSKSPLSISPGVDNPGFTLSVGETLLQQVTGTAVLTFTVSPALVGTGLNTPASYVDPALQFVDASGKPLGATYNFTFPAGTTSITLPAIDPGSVLGTVDLTINAAGLPQTATSILVAGGTPVIQAGSVQFTNVTSTGFDVEIIAMVPTRTASTATLTFNSTSGDTISGQQTFTFDVSKISNAWFASADGLKYGGLYSLTFPFVFNGSVSAIGSVTVSLDGSQPVTGSR